MHAVLYDIPAFPLTLYEVEVIRKWTIIKRMRLTSIAIYNAWLLIVKLFDWPLYHWWQYIFNYLAERETIFTPYG